MDVALPGIHDAAGEQVDVVAAGCVFRSSQRKVAGQAQALGRKPQPDRKSEQRASEPEQSWIGECAEGQLLTAGREFPGLGEGLAS